MDASKVLSSDKNGKLNPLLRSVFDKLDVAVVIANLQREIVMVNASAEALFQYAEKEIWGKKTQILYASENDFEEQGKQRYNVDASYSSLYTITYVKKSGETFEGETQGGPIHDEHGNLIYFVGLIKDVSTQLSAERTLNSLHSIISDQTRSFTERVDANSSAWGRAFRVAHRDFEPDRRHHVHRHSSPSPRRHPRSRNDF